MKCRKAEDGAGDVQRRPSDLVPVAAVAGWRGDLLLLLRRHTSGGTARPYRIARARAGGQGGGGAGGAGPAAPGGFPRRSRSRAPCPRHRTAGRHPPRQAPAQHKTAGRRGSARIVRARGRAGGRAERGGRSLHSALCGVELRARVVSSRAEGGAPSCSQPPRGRTRCRRLLVGG